ncbi:SDR family oxidoreductase [Mucilaginibacter sp. KACC 22063]|uniref:SDR family oxidoreductase n=1 Tax=Mucilaginibacter sp. KACC 22063 TaxID=3025666 RepID=UPI0023652BC6|nr:SDR family oxidoreductase [Mucilaginibacter sp. KACC 22063]WDF56947.1 SDR family oxidoreductase [Mucilaginibacter sp. KACC 22063]
MEIFLTGATGLVGGEVLVKLSKKSEVNKIFCLIRAASVEDGRNRLQHIFALHNDEFDETKIIPVIGDLFDDGLTTQLKQSPLLNNVTTIIHSAANTSFAKVKDDLVEKANIGGLTKILLWAKQLNSLNTFMYVGTATICGKDVKHRLVTEDESPNNNATHLVKYTYTKLRGEQLLKEHLPEDKILVVRPSIIMGDSRGIEPRSPVILWALATMNKLRLVPANPYASLDMVPVDFVADVMTQLLFVKRNYRVYHISAGNDACTSALQLAKVFDHHFDDLLPHQFVGKEMLNPLKLWAKGKLPSNHELFEHQDYLDYIEESFEDVTNLRILFAGLDPYIEFAELGQRFDNSRIIEDLGITPSLPGHVYIHKCLKYIERINLLEGAIDP